MPVDPVFLTNLPPWVPLVVQGILLLVSAVFAVAAWTYKQEIKKRDENQKEMQKQLVELLKLVPVLESLRADIDAEVLERKRINEQQWSKLNTSQKLISDLASTQSKTQNECKTEFMTQREWERMERLRERQDDMLVQQVRRLEDSVTRAISMLQRMNGRK